MQAIGEYLNSISNKYNSTDTKKGSEMNYRSQFEKLLESIFDLDGMVAQINHDLANYQDFTQLLWLRLTSKVDLLKKIMIDLDSLHFGVLWQ